MRFMQAAALVAAFFWVGPALPFGMIHGNVTHIVPLACPYLATAATDGCSQAVAVNSGAAQMPNFFSNGLSDGTAAQSGQSYKVNGVNYTGEIVAGVLHIAAAPDLSGCLPADPNIRPCTLSDAGGLISRGTYITSAIDSSHWNVSIAQDVGSETLALFRRHNWNVAGVDYPVGAYTDFATILASGSDAAKDAINPAVSTPAGCVWHATGWPYNAAMPYLVCTPTAGPRLPVQHLYFGPIAAYGGGGGGRATHGCTGIQYANNNFDQEDVMWDGDTECTENIVASSGEKINLVKVLHSDLGHTGSFVIKFNTINLNMQPGDAGDCCSQPAPTQAMVVWEAGTIGFNYWHHTLAGYYGEAFTNTVSRVVISNELVDTFGWSVANGHLEFTTPNPYLQYSQSYETFLQGSGGTATHQAAWRSLGSPGATGALSFDRNTLVWNSMGNSFGHNFSLKGYTATNSGGKAILTLTNDITDTTCGSDHATQCVLSRGMIGNGIGFGIHNTLSGDGFSAGSTFDYDCGVQTATTLCPCSSGSAGCYFAALASPPVGGTPVSITCTSTVCTCASGASCNSIVATVSSYMGFDVAGAQSSGTLSCNGSSTDVCLYGNAIDQTGGFNTGIWKTGTSCATPAVVAGNLDLVSGASLNTVAINGTGC